ncbi:unnamed protein product [Caretta caretta]
MAHNHQSQFPYFTPPWTAPGFSYPMPWPQWYPWPHPSTIHPQTSSTKPLPSSVPRSSAPSTSRVPEPPPENMSYGPYPDSPTPDSPSAPDGALFPPPSQNMDDCKQFQELFKRVALSQVIPLEEVQETQHRLLKMLQPSAPSKIALPINKALLEPADTLANSNFFITNLKKTERKYYVPAKDADFLFSHPQPNSLVMDAVAQWTKQPQYRPILQDKDLKNLDVFGRKVYTSSTVQFRIANYSVLLAIYNFSNYNKLFEFASYIPENRRADFKSILAEGQLISRTALQAALDMADSSPYYCNCCGYAQIFMALCIWHPKRSADQSGGPPSLIRINFSPKNPMNSSTP